MTRRRLPNLPDFDPVPADVIDRAKEAFDPPDSYRYDPGDGLPVLTGDDTDEVGW